MFCKSVATYYATSRSFDQADSRFRQSLQPNLHLFSLDAINYLIPKIEENNQVYWRGLASIDHPIIMKRARQLDVNFDVTEYPHFSRTVGDDEDENED
jgi:hypothetical protein